MGSLEVNVDGLFLDDASCSFESELGNAVTEEGHLSITNIHIPWHLRGCLLWNLTSACCIVTCHAEAVWACVGREGRSLFLKPRLMCFEILKCILVFNARQQSLRIQGAPASCRDEFAAEVRDEFGGVPLARLMEPPCYDEREQVQIEEGFLPVGRANPEQLTMDRVDLCQHVFAETGHMEPICASNRPF